jgi:hypothetical protein
MSNKTEFERQLMALDRDKLIELLAGTIGMYQEYIEVHGHSEDSAKWAAINEVVTGTEAMIELDDHGEL